MGFCLSMGDASPPAEQSVSDFLRILEEHRIECENEGKYVQAEIAKKRLDELRDREENRQREAMKSRQITELLGVEEAHMMEFQQFNAIWDKKMEEFEMNAKELIDNMRKKHANELFRFKDKLQKNMPYRPKFSKELLNSRKIQETLAKMKQYAEAHKIKLKADRLEEIELEKLRQQHAHKLAAQEMQFAQRQQLELQALEKRVDTARQEHKIQRQHDLERILQRYQNVKSELEAQQNIERIRSEKYKGHSAMYSTISATGSRPPSSRSRPASSRSQKNSTPRR